MKRTNELEHYADYLLQRELAEQTRAIYVKQAAAFLDFLENREMTKKESIAYKQMLLKRGQKLSTVNLYLVALNSYLRYAGYGDCTVKTMKRQRRQCPDDILTHAEYRKLLIWAKESGRQKYYCIMRTLALTGIRVSELSGCTVEALRQGQFLVSNKGKSREVYLPEKLITELWEYCRQENIKEGVIFLGNMGKAISRAAVYKMLTQMAEYVGIPKKKAHPHSFRHLFAITYMQQYANLFELADLLGHSSLETTRIYTATTADEKRKKINRLEL
ncbi:MAG: tyrosine-type recombinase/integrase [Lachnospiraceae bacterium]|nr:tyrosine-type recombinase/integrase [Lachnospiraceae bacterium]